MALEIVWRNPIPPAKTEGRVEPIAVDDFDRHRTRQRALAATDQNSLPLRPPRDGSSLAHVAQREERRTRGPAVEARPAHQAIFNSRGCDELLALVASKSAGVLLFPYKRKSLW